MYDCSVLYMYMHGFVCVNKMDVYCTFLVLSVFVHFCLCYMYKRTVYSVCTYMYMHVLTLYHHLLQNKFHTKEWIPAHSAALAAAEKKLEVFEAEHKNDTLSLVSLALMHCKSHVCWLCTVCNEHTQHVHG